MSDHEGESGRAGLRGDPPPFTPEQLAWLEEYRSPTSVTGAVTPGSAPSAPPGPPWLVTAASVPGKCHIHFSGLMSVYCLLRNGAGSSGRRREAARALAPPPLPGGSAVSRGDCGDCYAEGLAGLAAPT